MRRVEKYWKIFIGTHTHVDILDKVLIAYSEDHRYFHTIQHLEDILSWLEEADKLNFKTYLATLYHDIIYIPTRKDNEEKSSLRAQTEMSKMNLPTQFIHQVSNIILATKSHLPTHPYSDEAYFLDADMGVLGTSESSFQKYCKQIQEEYKSIPPLLFWAGRKSFMQNLLKKKKIFHTTYFFEKFEEKARINLNHEIK